MPHRIRYKDRMLEWGLALGSVGMGVWLLRPAAALTGASGDSLRSIMSESSWGQLFLVIGLVHTISLAINGLRWWTPWTRTAMAIANSFAYAYWSWGIYQVNPDGTGVYTYGCMILSMFAVTVFRAVSDVVWHGKPTWWNE